MPFKSKETKESIDNFNEKYGVQIDRLYLERLIENINIDAQNMKQDGDKEPIHEALLHDIKEGYKRVFLDILNQKFEKEYRSDEPKTDIDEFAHDFDKLMFDSIFLETGAFNHVAPSDSLYAGMDEDEFDCFIATMNFYKKNDEIYNSFNGKETTEIASELDSKYGNAEDIEPEYGEIVAAIQAVKRRYDERGFFGKLFHPIDSIRESRLMDRLKGYAIDYYPGKRDKIDNDIDSMIVKDQKAKTILDPLYACKSEIIRARYEGPNYNVNKIREAREEYNIKSKVVMVPIQEARQLNKEKFEEIYPKFREVFEKHSGHLLGTKNELVSRGFGQIERVKTIDYYINKKDLEFIQQNRAAFYRKYREEYTDFKDNVFPKLKEAYDQNNHNMKAVKAEYKKDHKHGMFTAMFKFENELKRLNGSKDYFNYEEVVGSVLGPKDIPVESFKLEVNEAKNIEGEYKRDPENLNINEEIEKMNQVEQGPSKDF